MSHSRHTLACTALIMLGWVVLLSCSSACAEPAVGAAEEPISHSSTLANGLYAVLRESPTREETAGTAPNQIVLVYDRKYTDEQQDNPPEYVTLSTASFVPLIIEGAPKTQKDSKGFTSLQITLAKKHIQTLENFTRDNLNGKAAIVIGGEIITKHKVRSVVVNGELQITRCTDNACEVLRAKLAP